VARLELSAGHRIQRVGLSATLGDKALAAESLRPGRGQDVITIDAAGDGYELKLVVKGYVDEPVRPGPPFHEVPPPSDPNAFEDDPDEEQQSGSAKVAISDYLYKQLRGTNNLVFPNSRSQVEYYADRLRSRSESFERNSRRGGSGAEAWSHCSNGYMHDYTRTWHRHWEYSKRGTDRSPTVSCEFTTAPWSLRSANWRTGNSTVHRNRAETIGKVIVFRPHA
jgi:Lhr-like helicase